MMKYIIRIHTSDLRNKKGITLIALIITIIVLLILSGVTVVTLTGENGLLNRTSNAGEETKKKAAEEKMNLKITAAQIKGYSETQSMPTLQYLADELCEDDDMEYVILKEQEQASLGKITVGETDSILTKLKEYSYEFEIDKDLKLASINGTRVASNTSPSGTFDITANGEYNIAQYEKVNVNVAGGSTSGKFDLWTNWLAVAGIDTSAYDSASFLDDEALMTTLMNNEDAINYLINSSNLLIPAVANSEVAMTKLGTSNKLSNVLKNVSAVTVLRNSLYKSKIENNLTKSDNAMTSSENDIAKVIETSYDSTNFGYRAFDGTWTWQNGWISSTSEPVSTTVHPTLIYEFKKNSIVPYKFVVMGNHQSGNADTGKAYIEASKTGNDNDYKRITNDFELPYGQKITVYPNQNLDEYSYFKLVVTKETGTYIWKKAIISEWEIYGK